MTDASDSIAAKDALLEATLPNVVFDGWSAALATAARDLSVDPASLFPGGADEAREWLDDWADRRMAERMKSEDLSLLRLHERVGFALKSRIAVLDPYREAVRLALAGRFSPFGAAKAVRAIYHTVDTIWWEAGDASTDFSFYSKRAILAGIHSASMLYWLSDSSPDSADTGAFIDRRLKDVGQIPVLRRRAEAILGRCRGQAALVRRAARV